MERALRVAYVTYHAEQFAVDSSLLDLLQVPRELIWFRSFATMPRAGVLSAALDALDILWQLFVFAPWLSAGRSIRQQYRFISHRLKRNCESADRMRSNEVVLPVFARMIACDEVIVNADRMAGSVLASWRTPLVWRLRKLPQAHCGISFDGAARCISRRLSRVKALLFNSSVVGADGFAWRGIARWLHQVYNGLFTAAELAASLELPSFVPDVAPHFCSHDYFLALSYCDALGGATIEVLASRMSVVAVSSGADPEFTQDTGKGLSVAGAGFPNEGGAEA